jgi:hypothetical protein
VYQVHAKWNIAIVPPFLPPGFVPQNRLYPFLSTEMNCLPWVLSRGYTGSPFSVEILLFYRT